MLTKLGHVLYSFLVSGGPNHLFLHKMLVPFGRSSPSLLSAYHRTAYEKLVRSHYLFKHGVQTCSVLFLIPTPIPFHYDEVA